MKTKLWDVIKTVGSGVVREVVPGGGMLIDAVNEMLPPGQRLPNDATARDMERAIDSLPAEQRARVLEKEFAVDVERIQQSNETLRAMLVSDSEMKHTTRPYIAKHAFHVVAFSVVVTVSAWAYGVVIKDVDIVDAIMEGWPFMLSVIGPFVVLLQAYFGVLRDESKNRLNGGQSKGGFLSSVLTRRK